MLNSHIHHLSICHCITCSFSRSEIGVGPNLIIDLNTSYSNDSEMWCTLVRPLPTPQVVQFSSSHLASFPALLEYESFHATKNIICDLKTVVNNYKISFCHRLMTGYDCRLNHSGKIAISIIPFLPKYCCGQSKHDNQKKIYNLIVDTKR